MSIGQPLSYTVYLPQINETTLSQKDQVAAVSHRVAVNLRFDVDDLLGILLQPGNINLDVEVTDAASHFSNYLSFVRAA